MVVQTVVRSGDTRPLGDGVAQAVLVPVKRFADAKERLSPILSAVERASLARRLAEGVIRSVAPLPVAVVCDDEDVASWATALGAVVIWSPRAGLNAAVAAGVARLADDGYEWITIAHGDLSDPSALAELPHFEGVTLIPDRFDDGTNVLRLPSESAFAFSYGPGSFHRHLAEAERLDLPTSVIRGTPLDLDVDSPEDLEAMTVRTRKWGPEGPH